MFRQRALLRVTRPDENELIVQASVGRRLLYGGIGVLLIVSFLVGVDWQEDIVDGLVAGTIFYFVITAICVGVAGWNSPVRLSHRDGKVRLIRSMFGFTIGHSTFDLSDVRSVVIQGLRFLREHEQPAAGLLSSRFRGYVEHRNVYYKLYLESSERLLFVGDSTDLSDLESAARAMAEFVGVTYRREEI